MRPFLLLFAAALNTFAAGPLIFGARGGVGLTDNFSGLPGNFGSIAQSRQYAIGPTVGLRLPLGFSIEGDALFHRETLNLGGLNLLDTHQDSWEFPAMLKFTAGHWAVAPVIGAGVSVRHLNNFSGVPSFLLSGSTSSNTVGAVVGGGIRFKAGPAEITPELRYTHWGGNSFAQSVLNFIEPNGNQAEVLVGITF